MTSAIDIFWLAHWCFFLVFVFFEKVETERPPRLDSGVYFAFCALVDIEFVPSEGACRGDSTLCPSRRRADTDDRAAAKSALTLVPKTITRDDMFSWCKSLCRHYIRACVLTQHENLCGRLMPRDYL